MAATINQKVAATQHLTTGAEFHGQASDDSADKNSADKAVALFDGSQTSFEPQDGPVQPANLPILFRPKYLDRLGTSQTHHCGNKALGIRTKPLVRHALDFESNGSKSIGVQTCAEKMLIVPRYPGENNQITWFDVKTGVVSSTPATTMGVRTLIATKTGFALLWSGTENGTEGQYLTHIDAQTNTILWTKLLSDDQSTHSVYLQETADGELVAMRSVKEVDSADKFQLFRFNAETGEPLGRTGDDAMVRFYGYGPQLSYYNKPVFFCDRTGRSIVLVAPYYSSDKQRLVSVDFKDQATHSVCDLPFTWSDFNHVAMRNGRVLVLPKDGKKAGYDITFRTLSDFEIKPIAADFVRNSGSGLISNTNEDFAVEADYYGTLVFYQMTDNGFECVKVIERLGPQGRASSEALAMTQDNVVYYSAITAIRDGEFDCRLLAYDASTREELWSIDKTFDASAHIAVNDDGSLTWFTASGGVILAAP